MRKAADALRGELIDAAITSIAERGILHFSLREVTGAIGRSTSAVSHHFGDKDGLLDAAGAVALAREAALHVAFAEWVCDLPLDSSSTADVVVEYILRRSAATDAVARFWWEITFNGAWWTGAADALDRLRRGRIDFWRRLLPGMTGPAASVLAEYAAIESLYAAVLRSEGDYRLVLRETVRQFLPPNGDAGRGGIAARLSQRSMPAAPRDRGGTHLADRLIAAGAEEILEHGVGALNHRRVTAKIGASPSMIVYHFGNNATFLSQAIWAALLGNLPTMLDNAARDAGPREDMAAWRIRMAGLLGAAQGDAFYVRYTRILGQTCLLAQHDASMIPLVRHLRMLEGTGIHHASETVWPRAVALTRAQSTAFAIWIKGHAVPVAAATTPATLEAVVDLLRTGVTH